MSDTEAKRSRIKDKIAASQARLLRDAPVSPPVRRNLPDAHPPQDYRSLAGEYPWLTVAGGLAAGLLIGALIPKQAGSKLGKHALSVATVAAEIGLALSKQARDAAGEAAQSGAGRLSELGQRLDEGTAGYRTRARRTAGKAVASVRGAGQRAARAAQQLADGKRG
jgi:hypothetical protein